MENVGVYKNIKLNGKLQIVQFINGQFKNNLKIMVKNKKLIVYYLANKYDLPLKKVEEIINYQFKYIEKIMKEGKFETIRLPYFGKFSVNSKRVEYINKKKNESN